MEDDIVKRIDIAETEAEFIEFGFRDKAAADAAEACFPADFVRCTDETIDYRAGRHVPAIREALERSGLVWREAESNLEDTEMWPEWPNDEVVDEEATFPRP